MVVDTGKDVGEPSFGVDGVELCCFDQGVDGSSTLPTSVGSDLSPDWSVI